MKKILAALIPAALLVIAQPAFGWSEETHMTTGAIAFDDLARSDPALLSELVRIIAAHPDYAKLAAHAGKQSGAARTRAVFEWLARWPDDIRGSSFDRPEWHYELRVVSGWTAIWPFRNGSARAGFDENYRTLADAKAPMAARAVALGWILHIVGDIQQPLHAGHRMSSDFPKTDRAGQLGFVRRTQGGAPVDLHQFWDKMLDQPGGANATSAYWSGRLQTLWPRARLPELSSKSSAQLRFSTWLDESMILARIGAYSGAFVHASPEPAKAPAVSQSYARVMQRVAERRVALGGYRIADTIRLALTNG